MIWIKLVWNFYEFSLTPVWKLLQNCGCMLSCSHQILPDSWDIAMIMQKGIRILLSLFYQWFWFDCWVNALVSVYWRQQSHWKDSFAFNNFIIWGFFVFVSIGLILNYRHLCMMPSEAILNERCQVWNISFWYLSHLSHFCTTYLCCLQLTAC